MIHNYAFDLEIVLIWTHSLNSILFREGIMNESMNIYQLITKMN